MPICDGHPIIFVMGVSTFAAAKIIAAWAEAITSKQWGSTGHSVNLPKV
jgi:hypothetical protein